MQIVDRKTKNERTLLYDTSVKFLYNTLLGRIILKLLIGKFTANIVAKYLSSKASKKRIIKTIVKNNIDMSIFEEKEFRSFNDFFLRRKKNLNIDMQKTDFISPADAKLLVYKMSEDTVFDIKGSYYKKDDIVDKGVLDGYCEVIEMFDTAVLDLDHENDFELMEVIATYLFDRYSEFTEVNKNIRI